MSTITGKVTDFGGSRLAGLMPQLDVLPDAPSTFGTQMLSTKAIRVNLLDPDDSFSFTLIASDEMRPPRPYTFHLQWINGAGVPVGSDYWHNVWVPVGTWTISDLLGALGVSQTQVVYQATEPTNIPIGTVWVNTVTGDIKRRKA